MKDETPHADTPPDRDVFFRFYADSWRGDEQLRLCSLAARGLWIELLAFAHKSGGYVRLNGRPPELKELAVIVGAKPGEVGKLLAELTKYGVCSVAEDGAIMSRRMVRDAARRAASKANGKLGGRPKQKPNSKPRSNLDETQTEPKAKPNSKPTIDLDIDLASDSGSDAEISSVISTAEADRFERFWAAYPRKASKAKAAGAFLSLNPSEKLLAKMLAAIEWQRNTPDWTKDNGHFIPYPENWLEGRRWQDEPFQGGQPRSLVPDAEETRRRYLL